MNEYIRAVLRVIAESQLPLGWYQIELRLSNIALDARPDLPPVLQDLVKRGWILEISASEIPTSRYTITTRGLEEIVK